MSKCIEIDLRSKRQAEELDEYLGGSYDIWELLKRPPVRSGNLLIHEMHVHGIAFNDDHSELRHCTIEMRKNGLEIRFQNDGKLMAWCIPFYKLSMFQSTHLTIHASGYFLRLKHGYTLQNKFFQRVLSSKNEALGYL